MAPPLREIDSLPRRQAASLQEVAHRPWPLPRAPWMMGQSWCDLLFAHWAVEPERLTPFLPDPLRLETHAGTAWLGITPFFLRGLHVRLTPPVPLLSSFCEVNVRLYVRHEDKPGIFFLTLDASSATAVAGGRLLAALPYRRACFSVARHDGWVDYSSRRAGFRLRARYAAREQPLPAAEGSLEAFLVERYCLYTTRAGRLWRLDVHHAPWSLHEPRPGSAVEAELRTPALALRGPPLLHVGARQDVALWAPVPVARVRSHRRTRRRGRRLARR